MKGRLIEIFGTPYSDDIGPGRTYPAGYDGPDLYHYMEVDASELTGQSAPATDMLTAYFKPMADGTFFSDDDADPLAGPIILR